MSAVAVDYWAAAQPAGGESADQATAATLTSFRRVLLRACTVLGCGSVGLPVTTRPDTRATAPAARLRRSLWPGCGHDAENAPELPASHGDRIGAQNRRSRYRCQLKAQRRTSSRTDVMAPSKRQVQAERFALPTGRAAALYPSLVFRAAGVSESTSSPKSPFIGQWRGPVTTDDRQRGVRKAF